MPGQWEFQIGPCRGIELLGACSVFFFLIKGGSRVFLFILKHWVPGFSKKLPILLDFFLKNVTAMADSWTLRPLNPKSQREIS